MYKSIAAALSLILSLILGVAALAATAAPTAINQDLQKSLIDQCAQKFNAPSRAQIEQLLKEGADLNQPDTEVQDSEAMGKMTVQKTCLAVAVANLNTDLIQYVLNKGALVLKADIIESIPYRSITMSIFDVLQETASNLSNQGQSQAVISQIDNLLVPYLIQELKYAKQSIDTSIDREGESALTMSVAMRASQSVQLLLDAGADINSKTRDGYTPLSEAILNDDVATAAVLLKHSARVECTTNTCPLMSAVWTDDANLVGLLLQYHADPQVQGRDGEYVLDLAARSANPTLQMIQELINAGADPSSIYNEKDATGKKIINNVTPLLSTIGGIGQGDGTLGERAQIVEYLLRDKKVDPNQGCDYGMTPIGLAQSYANEAPIVTLLKTYGANANQTKCTAK